MNFWQLTTIYPPILVRLLARKPKGPPLTNVEIADAAGLPVSIVNSLAWSTSWAGIDLPTMQKFLFGCRFDLCNHRHRSWASTYIRRQLKAARVRRRNWVYLRQSRDWDSLYQPLILRYLQHLQLQPR